MQSDQAPCNSAGRVEFSSSITSALRDQRDESSPLLGGIFSDAKLSWLSRGPLLEVVHIADGAKIASWTFGAVVRDFKTKVTCVAELPHLTAAGCPVSIDQVAVGLECELTGGMICLFNLAGSRVLRAINIPSKVTAIDTVALGGENLGPLHPSLKPMSGIVAVGTNDGQILLIDLRRSDCDNALCSASSTHWEGIRDELQSCGLISLKDADNNTLEDYPEDHLYLHLNEYYFLKHQRLVMPLSSRDGNPFLPEDPSVTSILYVPQLGSLVVGFAFGAFQIWSLQSLSLVYTLPVTNANPLVRLSFQEACDDPNAYCYLWAVRGGLGSNDSAGDLEHPVPVYGPPSATMFSLCYDEKVWLPEYGWFYKNFMMCSTGFEFDLSGGKETVGGRLISLSSVSRGVPGSGAVHSPFEDSSAFGPSSNSISLCLIVWETWGPTGPSSSVNPVNSHMAVFDINQWYVDQMPSRLFSRSKSVASYLVSYDLGNVISAGGGLLLDVRIKATSLVQFSSIQNSEEFSRPSSLSFGSEVLMEREVVHLKHPGVQRALLSNLVSNGPGTLITPTQVFHECLVLGLRPLLMDISGAINVPVDEQRTFVVCVALEQRLGRFVNRCAREWADGRLSAAGCTLSWLLSVVWNRAAILKQLAIRICSQLFDHSGEKLDHNAQRQLHHIVGIFHLLETLFENVVENRWHLALNEWPQVNLQNDALKLECQYYDVLQWLIDVELLPEGMNPAVPYPAQEIAEYYNSRRSELRRLLQQQGGEEEMQNLLLVDGLLMNEAGGQNVFAEWERDAGGSAGPGSGVYPPVSLQALLRTFLIKDVALSVKHSIVIYVLMDLANILDNEQYQKTLQNFMKFPAAFCMSAGTMRLTQAFWHLDHKAFDTALEMLLDPLVSVRDISLWQHRCIIRLLTLQGQANMALRYVRARRPALQEESDIRLHLNLLIANDHIDEAFMYQRNHRSEENVKTLLLQFFQGCEERNNLKTILQFSLDNQEEMAFSRYLESSKHPAADDLRVLYLLKRSRYVEAFDVNQDLRKKGRSGGTRDVVVSGFYKTLPSVTRKLAAHCAQQQNKLKSWTQVEKPSPLFVNPKITSPQMRCKSSLLEAAVEKSRETWSKLVERVPHVTSEIESTPFLCTPRTKVLTCPRPTSTVNNDPKIVGRKRVREDDVDNLNASDLKRSRFQKLETALAQLHQQSQQEQQKAMKERYSTYTCTDTLTLMHTPVVQRRSPSSRAKLQQQMIACSPGHSSVTPQSIIKVRQASGASKSDSPKRVLIKDTLTEPELTEEDSESEPFSSRKPNKGESETDSEPGDKDDEEGPVGVTARRIIDFDTDISSDLSASQSSFESHTSPSTSPTPSKSSLISSERSLSKMVMLSEARKAGKPHTVTFGKGSICVYDQDQPVDSEVAVQDESSNDTVDQEPCRDENPNDVQDDMFTERKDYENSVLDDCANASAMETEDDEDSKYRSFHFGTSGAGTTSASQIQTDLSHTEDSEMFHSADSTAQGTMCSPNFRKSLARPPVRELTRRLSGSKRTQHDVEDDYDDDNDDDSNKDSDSKEISRKSARLDRIAHITSSSHISLGSENQKDEEEAQDTPAVYVQSTLARPPIKNVHLGVGQAPSTINASVMSTSGVDGSETELLELYSAQSASYESSREDIPADENQPCEISPTLVEEVVDDNVNHETSNTHLQKSHDSVEIVELDDDMEDEDVQAAGKVPEAVVQVVEEDSVGVQDEDSGDRIIISENSNICDDTDSSSGSSSGSLDDKSESDGEHASSDSYPQPCGKGSGLDSEETSRDNSESQDGSDLNRACVMVSEGVSTDACESVFANVESSSASVSVPHESKEGASSKAFVQEKMDTDESVRQTAVDINLTEEATETLPSSEPCVPCDKPSEAEQDDMPSLRLDAATSNENLFEPPLETVDDSSSVKLIVGSSSQNVCVKAPTESSSFTEDNTKSVMDSSPISPIRVPVDAAPVATPLRETELSTPKSSKRRGTSRRSSISSTVSEAFDGDTSNRRVTRSQRSRIMDQSFESTTSAAPEAEEEAIFKPRTRSSSISSQDGLKESSKPTCSTVEARETKTRRRRTSVSSQGSVADHIEDVSCPNKLDKISEEGSDKASAAGPPSGRKVQRKRKASEVSDITSEVTSAERSPNSSVLETYETSRRLTRHQRALLAKSMEMNSMHASMNRSVQLPDKAEDDQESDDDRMSVCSVRSSQRLRAKRQQQLEAAHDSPSSTASTVINPALTPTPARRRRQSNSDVSELNRDASPASAVRRQRSLQLPGTPSSVRSTPTRRSARLSSLSVLHAGSQQSEDGDNQSLASLSPSSVTSGRRSATRRPGRRLSMSSEASEQQFAFASPQIEYLNTHENADTDVTEAFVFSPPKTIATPSKARSSSTDSGGSASRKTTRQSKASALQTIREESSASRISVEETETTTNEKSTKRQSWFFIQPQGDTEETQKNAEDLQAKQPSASKRGRHSAYSQRKFSVIPISKHSGSEDDGDTNSEKSEEIKLGRKTRQSASNRKSRI